jgi:hypothetical protein
MTLAEEWKATHRAAVQRLTWAETVGEAREALRLLNTMHAIAHRQGFIKPDERIDR